MKLPQFKNAPRCSKRRDAQSARATRYRHGAVVAHQKYNLHVHHSLVCGSSTKVSEQDHSGLLFGDLTPPFNPANDHGARAR